MGQEEKAVSSERLVVASVLWRGEEWHNIAMLFSGLLSFISPGRTCFEDVMTIRKGLQRKL